MLASLDQTPDVTTASYGMRLLCSYEPLGINVDFKSYEIPLAIPLLDRYFSGNISNAIDRGNDASEL
jgi:hypothetical protein